LNFAMLRQSCNTSVRLSSCQSSPSTLVNSIAIGQNRPSGVVRPRAPTKILTVSASSSEEDSSAGFFDCTEDSGGSACPGCSSEEENVEAELDRTKVPQGTPSAFFSSTSKVPFALKSLMAHSEWYKEFFNSESSPTTFTM